MIYVECKPDFVLVNSLGIDKRHVIHKQGKSKVYKILEKRNNSKGLVDDDPLSEKLNYAEKLNLIYDKHEIKVFYDAQRKNYLIVLYPRLEEWILKSIKEAKIDIKKYALPDNAIRLHKIININISKFEKLIMDIKGRSNKLKALRSLLLTRRFK